MNVMDIISAAVRHMVEGLMFHDQMMQFFLYLGMPGLARLQEKRYLDESRAMADLQKYAIRAYGMIASDSGTSARDYIPSTWRDSPRNLVDLRGTEDARVALETWEGWEADTKKLYSQLYFQAGEVRDAGASEKMAELVRGVDKEHRFVSELVARARAVDHDPGAMALIDASVCEDYKKFMKRR